MLRGKAREARLGARKTQKRIRKNNSLLYRFLLIFRPQRAKIKAIGAKSIKNAAPYRFGAIK
jgi:hypothetical protein